MKYKYEGREESSLIKKGIYFKQYLKDYLMIMMMMMMVMVLQIKKYNHHQLHCHIIIILKQSHSNHLPA